MDRYEDIRREIGKCTREAEELLARVAASSAPATDDQINDLEHYAARIAKFAYGNDRPEYVSEEMHALISWCDHVNEGWVRQQFTEALAVRPLREPPWSGS